MIRVIEDKDYEQTKELLEALMKETVYSKLFENYSLSKEMFEAYTKNYSDRIGIFTLDEDKVTGIGVFDTLPWIGCDAPIRIARLSFIYVKPEFRTKGFGKEIMKAFEHWGKSVNASFYSIGHKAEGYNKMESIYMKEIK